MSIDQGDVETAGADKGDGEGDVPEGNDEAKFQEKEMELVPSFEGIKTVFPTDSNWSSVNSTLTRE